MLVCLNNQFDFGQLIYGSRQVSLNIKADISRQTGVMEFMNSKQWIRFAIRRVI